MLRYLLILCISFSINSFGQGKISSGITTYYLIRHAEKDRSNPSERDAHLTKSGLQRAEQWSTILQNTTFDAVYATDYKRTKETAQPTALKNKLDVRIYNANSYYDKDFEMATKGKTVLVVGHSDTIPHFVNAIIGTQKYDDIDDGNNGNLYIVTLVDGKVIDLVLTIN